MRDVLSATGTSFGPGELLLRMWATEHTGDRKEQQSQVPVRAVHAHYPALLSAIYYLRLPSTGDHDVRDFGTIFYNYFPQGLIKSAPATVVRPSTGDLVVFPSWVLHEVDLVSNLALTPSRLTIIADGYYLPLDAGVI